ncbi:MAG: BT_3987 domain-containing protein [Bacteroidales bacterium]
MKNIFLSLITLLTIASCQNELYNDPTKDFISPQGVYVANKGLISVFTEEDTEFRINDFVISLSQKNDAQVTVQLEVGNEEQLALYNKENGTTYLLLPKEMYDISSEVIIEAKNANSSVPLQLKNIRFSTEGVYALPIKIKNADVGIISGQDEGLIVIEQKIITKSLRINGQGHEDANMFPNDFTVPQWTMEVMINRSKYESNNQAIGGTKLANGVSVSDEIFTRFGDVTINPNQLQIKTGSSQIDVAADKFSAQPDTWYMLSFVYDGKINSVYVNGILVASQEIRTGSYSLVGIWISGLNELIREFRFWKIARTPQQILQNVWKNANPDDTNLLLYYPMNGKKIDRVSGNIVEDETKVWDWTKNEKHLPMRENSTFDDNAGDYFVFPPQ